MNSGWALHADWRTLSMALWAPSRAGLPHVNIPANMLVSSINSATAQVATGRRR